MPEQEILSQSDLSRNYSFEVLDLNNDGMQDIEEMKQAEKISQLMPKFKFSNLTGKRVTFKLENESHDEIEELDFKQDENFVFTLEAGQSFMEESSSECRKIRRAVKTLL